MSAKKQTILVLVESPAKCSKIESYLGPGYRCIATYGHFRELDGLKSIDVKNNFKLSFHNNNNFNNNYKQLVRK